MSEHYNHLNPEEMVEYTTHTGELKAHKRTIKSLLNGFIAGVFIALAAYGSLVASYSFLGSLSTYGLGKLIAGVVFAAGLIMVLIGGGELFTGNSLLIVSYLNKKISLREMLHNWLFVYLGNFIGSLVVLALIYFSGLLAHNQPLALTGLNMAVSKVNHSFIEAVCLGVLCNILVAAAVWMSYATKDVAGRILAIFFPVMLFILSGFEHSVANMFYLPLGLLLKGEFGTALLASGTSGSALAQLTVPNALFNNLLPVTIGNIIGGCLFIGILYWYSNRKETMK